MFTFQGKKKIKKKKIRQAEMWIRQERENSVKCKSLSNIPFCMLPEMTLPSLWNMYQTITSRQTDAVVWNILVNRFIWQLFTRMLMKNRFLWKEGRVWGFLGGGKERSQFFRHWYCSKLAGCQIYSPVQWEIFFSYICLHDSKGAVIFRGNW